MMAFFFGVVGGLVFNRSYVVQKKFGSCERKGLEKGIRVINLAKSMFLALFSNVVVVMKKRVGRDGRGGEEGSEGGGGVEVSADRKEMRIFLYPFSLGFQDLKGREEGKHETQRFFWGVNVGMNQMLIKILIYTCIWCMYVLYGNQV